VSSPPAVWSAQQWAARHRSDDGEQQPISPVEREFGLESQGRRHGLEVMWPLLRALGNPHLAYPTIHVGGSKGKGSTVAQLSAICTAAGYRVGMYISPSLTHFGERIQIDGRPLSDAEAEQGLSAIRGALRGIDARPRFFEAATALAFHHFAKQSVDLAVIEVGLGGGRDATNVVQPELAIVTTIELEHTQILGDTLEAIAAEKAGIIKPSTPTISAVSDPEALGPIERACADRGSTLWRLGPHFEVRHLRSSATAQQFDVWFGERLGAQRFIDLQLALAGEAQCKNAALATAAAHLLRERLPRLTEASIRLGLNAVHWPGRLELRTGRPSVLLDVAHTPSSVRHLCRYLQQFFGSAPKALVMGLMRDKDADALAEQLAPEFDHIIVAPVKWFRSMEPEQLQRSFRRYRDQVDIASTVCAGVEWARQRTPADGLVVVAGSVFAVGEAKRRFGWV
jgi:dihydrofolate synthase/folylpolyglutamate synthase